MNLLPIKASRISNLTDARYFAARGVDWLTFELDPSSENHLSPAEVHAIAEWVEGPQVAANFGLQDATEIADWSKDLQLDAIQLHPFMPLHQLEALEGQTIFQNFVVENLNDIQQQLGNFIAERSSYVNYFVLDFNTNQFGWDTLVKEPEIISALKKYCQQHPIFFQISFSNNNPLSFVENIKPYGLDVSGSEEEKVGYKSFDELDDLLDHLEILE